MKKTLKIAALCGLLTIILLATASCSNIMDSLFGTTEEPHTHTFGNWTILKNATCIEKGQQERTCSCGEKETQEIKALGHTEAADAAVAPTCTTDGLTAGSHCSTCGEVFVAQDVIPAEHNWMQLSLLEPATCFTYGEERRSCRVCGVVEDAPVEPLEHNFVLDEESQYHTCSLCNGILFAGHVYVAFEGEYHWFDAYQACEDMGGHLVTVTSAKEQEVLANIMNSELRTYESYWMGGIRLSNNQMHWITEEVFEFHNWAPGEPNNNGGNQPFANIRSCLHSRYATSWDDDYYYVKLGFVCEWELNITDCEHNFTEWEITTEAICWNDGEQYRVCTYCGVEENEVLPQLEHNFVVDEANSIEVCEHCKAAKYNGHIYVIFQDKVSWFEAYSYCEALGGYLATVTSEEEQKFVLSYLQLSNCKDSVWLGGYTIDAKKWEWITGEAFEYTNWYTNQPDTYQNKEFFLAIAFEYANKWNDGSPIEGIYFLCEFECEE